MLPKITENYITKAFQVIPRVSNKSIHRDTPSTRDASGHSARLIRPGGHGTSENAGLGVTRPVREADLSATPTYLVSSSLERTRRPLSRDAGIDPAAAASKLAHPSRAFLQRNDEAADIPDKCRLYGNFGHDLHNTILFTIQVIFHESTKL